MSIEMVLYLIDVIGNFGNLFFICGLLTFASTILFFAFTMSEAPDGRDKPTFQKLSKYSFFISIVFAFFCLLAPSQKTMYMMLATNTAKKSEIPEKVLKAIEMKLDEYIDEVKDKVKK